MTEIVKVQSLIITIDSRGVRGIPTLVYAKNHKNTCFVELTDDDLREKLGDDLKAYFNATWTGKTWVINDRVADQPW